MPCVNTSVLNYENYSSTLKTKSQHRKRKSNALPIQNAPGGKDDKVKKIIWLLLLVLFTWACAPAKIVVVTVVVPPTLPLATNALTATNTPNPTLTPTATPNPCLLWSQVTIEMVGKTICVRGIIRQINITNSGSHWDFTDDRTGFFAVSSYDGWHPVTGKDMSVGDCVAITGVIQVLSNGRSYIYWGATSIFKAAVKGTGGYYEHPDLQVIEDNPAFCQ
jgi:hypothetical protein